MSTVVVLLQMKTFALINAALGPSSLRNGLDFSLKSMEVCCAHMRTWVLTTVPTVDMAGIMESAPRIARAFLR